MAQNLIMLATSVAQTAINKRDAAIAASKTATLKEVRETVVADALADQNLDITKLAEKGYVDNALTTAQGTLQTAIDAKADTSYVQSEIAEVKEALLQKADAEGLLDDYFTKEKITELLEKEADVEHVYLKGAIDEKFTTTNGNVTQNANDIAALQTTVSDNATLAAAATKAVSDTLGDFQTTVAVTYETKEDAQQKVTDITTALGKDVDDLEAVVNTKAAQTDLDTANGKITALENGKLDTTTFNSYKETNDAAVAAVKATADAAAVKTTVDAAFEAVNQSISDNADTAAAATKKVADDLSDYQTSNDAAVALKAATTYVDDELAKKMDKNDIWKNGVFDTTKTNADGSYAHMWNESDGGGSQYFNKTADMISYVGVNDGGPTGIAVQIYSKIKSTNSGVRINVNSNKAYYTVGNNTNPDGGVANDGREIAVKEDITAANDALTTAINGKVAQTDYDARVTTVDSALADRYTKSETYTKAEVDALINQAIADVLNTINNQMNPAQDGDDPADDDI